MFTPMATHENMEIKFVPTGYLIVIPNEFGSHRAVALLPTLEDAESFLTMFESEDDE